jgi:LacI family transcriptional regulator
MALKRITMQEIADACGLSRNTVSKVFNDRGSVPESTKKLVVAKARELGYYQYSAGGQSGKRQDGTIAVLTQHKLLSHNFGSYFITSFTDQISRSGYTMQMYEVSPEELAEKALPPRLVLERTAGILGIELFDRAYIDMVSINCKGEPIEVPDILIETEEQKREYEAAQKRKQIRKQRRQEGF